MNLRHLSSLLSSTAAPFCWGAPPPPSGRLPASFRARFTEFKAGQPGFALKDSGVKLPAGHPLSVQAERLFPENGVKTAMVEQGADIAFTEDKSLGGEGYRLTVTLIPSPLTAARPTAASMPCKASCRASSKTAALLRWPRAGGKGPAPLLLARHHDGQLPMMPVRTSKVLDLMSRYKFNICTGT